MTTKNTLKTEAHRHINYSMNGLGSHSCEPNSEECYELRPHEFKFAFILSGNTDEETILKLSRTDFGKKASRPSEAHNILEIPP